jgi:molybdenum cofactor guanylyltransferase
VAFPNPVSEQAVSIAGAILTGGASRRMGRDKPFVDVDGTQMVVRVAGALRAAGCDPVLAIGGDIARLAAAGLDSITDRWPGEGPLGGIITALHQTTTPIVVVATDVPWLDGATIDRLVAALTSGEAIAADVVVATSPRLEPLCALWLPRALPKLAASFGRGERAVHRALDELNVITVDVDGAALVNVNQPEDLHDDLPRRDRTDRPDGLDPPGGR